MDEPTQETNPTSSDSKRKQSSPPDGYLCNLCGVAGHWIQQCSQQRPNKKRKKRASTPAHVFVAGVDPSEADIEKARQLQKIKPPNCFCGITSRLKKVKRSSSKEGQHSRAIGKYFFFCAKQKSNDSKCRFARPVEDELTPKKERLCTFFIKTGKCKKGDKCVFRHELANAVVAMENQMATTATGKKHDTNEKPIEKEDNVDKSSSESKARPVEREGKDDNSISTSSDSDEDDDQQF
jgi:hypothetical protein